MFVLQVHVNHVRPSRFLITIFKAVRSHLSVEFLIHILTLFNFRLQLKPSIKNCIVACNYNVIVEEREMQFSSRHHMWGCTMLGCYKKKTVCQPKYLMSIKYKLSWVWMKMLNIALPRMLQSLLISPYLTTKRVT